MSELKEMETSLAKIQFPNKTYRKLYATKDTKAGFGTPFVCENDMLALRAFSDEVKRVDQRTGEKSQLGTHPEDYEIWKLGVMCFENGEIIPNVEFLGRALDYVNIEK